MEHSKTPRRDHELDHLDDFGKVKFDPADLAESADEQAQLDVERNYQARDDKPSAKRAPGGAGNPERPESR
jgi:hypothetical protein